MSDCFNSSTAYCLCHYGRVGLESQLKALELRLQKYRAVVEMVISHKIHTAHRKEESCQPYCIYQKAKAALQ